MHADALGCPPRGGQERLDRDVETVGDQRQFADVERNLAVEAAADGSLRAAERLSDVGLRLPLARHLGANLCGYPLSG